MGSDQEFERWLEQELQRAVRPLRGSRPQAAQSAYRAAVGRGETGPASKRPVASPTAKAAAGIAAALALGAGVKVAAASTGSNNPMFWASVISQTVLDLPTPQPQGSEQPLTPVGRSASPNAFRIKRMTSPSAVPTPQSASQRSAPMGVPTPRPISTAMPTPTLTPTPTSRPTPIPSPTPTPSPSPTVASGSG